MMKNVLIYIHMNVMNIWKWDCLQTMVGIDFMLDEHGEVLSWQETLISGGLTFSPLLQNKL